MIIVKDNLKLVSQNNIGFLLFFLVPISFIVGPAAINIILFLIFLFTIAVFIKEKNTYFINNITFKLSILFFVYINVVNIMNLDNNLLSELLKTISYLKYISLVIFIKYIYSKFSSYQKIFFLNFNLFIVVFVVIDLIFQKFTGANFFGFKPGICKEGYNFLDTKDFVVRWSEDFYCERFGGVFDQEFIAGTFLLFFGTIFIFLKYSNTNKKYFFISISILLIAILLTGDRLPLLMTLSSLFLFILISKNYRKFIFTYIFSLSVILLIIILLNPSLFQRYSYIYNKLTHNIGVNSIEVLKNEKLTIFKEVDNKKNKIFKNFYDTTWGAHYLVSARMIKEKPLFGSGNKTFRKQCHNYKNNIQSKSKKYACSTHPHNLFLEFLIDYGFVGLLLFLSIVISIFYKNSIKKNINKDLTLLYLICLIFIIFIPLKPSGSFFSTITGTTFFYLFGWVNFLMGDNKKVN
jgi:hypothetical protein